MKRFLTIALLLFSLASIANAQTGTWSGKLDIQGVKLSIVFHLVDENPTMDSPDQGVKGIPVQVERSATGMVTVKIPSLAASYEGLWLVKQIVGTFKQMGSSLPLTLTPGEDKPNRPQTPLGPFPYATEEVSFANGDAVLKGTLVLPEGYTRNTPVLIMVTGSGQQNRDEEIFEHKPFAVIADALARAGIATLRYDDRGAGESTGDMANATTEDLRDDALAGIKLLRERFDKVGVIGHSEGGTIALMLAADKQVDFVVSLAGMVISGAETLVWQSRLSLEGSGLPEETIDTYCKLIGEAFQVKVHGGSMPRADDYDLPEALKQNYMAVLMQIQTPWMARFLSLDMRPLLKNITCPVLAFNGTKDMQVACESNLVALQSGLPVNPKNRFEAVEGVNHLFQHCATGNTTEYREIEETFAPEVLGMMVQWVSTICFI
ncbi:MAG: alpha/beta hydrolase [Bacteroidales bacterium]|nr:alpha/beta hydrolase [Bacteroidales bacterium]